MICAIISTTFGGKKLVTQTAVILEDEVFRAFPRCKVNARSLHSSRLKFNVHYRREVTDMTLREIVHWLCTWTGGGGTAIQAYISGSSQLFNAHQVSISALFRDLWMVLHI